MWNISDIDEYLKSWSDYTEYVNNNKQYALYTKPEDEEKYKKRRGVKWYNDLIEEHDYSDILPIYCDDTIVGHLRYDHYLQREFITSKGDDPEVLNILKIWFNSRIKFEQRKLKKEKEELEYENMKKKAKEAKEARKALGFD